MIARLRRLQDGSTRTVAITNFEGFVSLLPTPRTWTAIRLSLGLLLLCGGNAFAQARPHGAGRVWFEIGAELNAQSHNCTTCDRTGNTAGPAVTGGLGVALPASWGIGLVVRKYQEFNYEHAQGSSYVLAVGQYSIPKSPRVTVNLGAGYARHNGDFHTHDNSGSGAAVSLGTALRLPASGKVAFAINASVVKTIGGESDFKPTTFAFGLGLNFATACRSSKC